MTVQFTCFASVYIYIMVSLDALYAIAGIPARKPTTFT